MGRIKKIGKINWKMMSIFLLMYVRFFLCILAFSVCHYLFIYIMWVIEYIFLQTSFLFFFVCFFDDLCGYYIKCVCRFFFELYMFDVFVSVFLFFSNALFFA